MNNEVYLVTPEKSAQIAEEAAQKNEILGLDEVERERVIDVLKPHLVAVLAYFTIALILLIVINFSSITALIGNNIAQQDGTFSEQLRTKVKYFSDNQIVGWITIVTFWGSVGLGVYTLFWLGSAFVTAARNEVVVETAFSNRGHFQDRVRVPLIRLLLIGLVAGLAIMTMRYGLPLWNQLASIGISSLASSIALGVLECLAAVFGAMLNIHLLRVGITLFRRADNIF
ncbi:hypothetical protein KBC99_03270 [Candidatus Saccharibacteria bacterium]|nr:hypothetical protein [Candidatus Saccharibacteria bacterium]